jgi:hypothetical protein
MTTDADREFLRTHLAELIRDEARRRNVPICVVLDMSPADFATEVEAGVRRSEFTVVPDDAA